MKQTTQLIWQEKDALFVDFPYKLMQKDQMS